MLIEGYNLGKLYETTPIVKKWVSEYIYNEQISKEEMIHNLISDLVMQNDSLRNDIMEMHKSRAIIKVVDELKQSERSYRQSVLDENNYIDKFIPSE